MLMWLCCVCCNCVLIGHVCERHNNPADFFLDVISENESSVTEGMYVPLTRYHRATYSYVMKSLEMFTGTFILKIV